MRSLNVALRLRLYCARITLEQRGNIDHTWSASRAIAAIAEAGIGLIHVSANAETVVVLVDQRDANRVRDTLTARAA